MINPLDVQSFGEECQWLNDGSGGQLIPHDNSPSQTMTVMSSCERGTPSNFRLASLPGTVSPNTPYFFEVVVLDLDESGGDGGGGGGRGTSSLSVGVVSSTEFRAGWKIRGMFYNGNLTNGSAALQIGFGDRIEKGSTIGIFINFASSDGPMQIIVYLNQRCLGVGFQLESVSEGEDEKIPCYYPCLHVDGQAKIKFLIPPTLPSCTDRQPASFDDPYSGDWTLTKAYVGAELHEFRLPDTVLCIFSFQMVGNGSEYRLLVKIANSFHCSIRITGQNNESFHLIEVGHVMGTRMMPLGEASSVEKLVATALPHLFKMIMCEHTGINHQRSLIMTGSDSELHLTRYERTFDPLQSYD